MRTRACVGVVVSSLALAVVGCAGGDDEGGTPVNSAFTGPCTPGMDTKMMVGTAMDPCPQDMCPDHVPSITDEYITYKSCPMPAAAGGTSTWSQCGCQPKCGNGVKQAGEECDGTDLGGMTCMAMGKTGVLSCTAQCKLQDMCMSPPVSTGGSGG